ncbi:uncharacterized protein LOC129307675 [Prosopis cineraria]|uniref:uncharacterized protein LOC129307675 n=1 Tax=Prosopis cineraria TaxID=364024 RepID=UPI0024102FC5|nr:uncharacterized protein LOC129307675 [Prosopis cineraria]
MLNSRDYHNHISHVHRTPSVLTDVPRYPNAYAAFNKTVVYEEDEGPHHHHHHDPPNERERVEVVEYKRADNYGNTEVVYEEADRYDAEADRYGNPRRTKLYKWKTYRD